MFWLSVLFHVRHCYITTKRQPCFRIYAVNVLHHGYYSTATRKWQKGRLMIFLPTKSSRRNKLHYIVTMYKLTLLLLSLVQFWLSAFTVVKTFIPRNYLIKIVNLHSHATLTYLSKDVKIPNMYWSTSSKSRVTRRLKKRKIVLLDNE